ncbi:MAG: hypothetical protein IT317_13330 [Anaerolineales bacterium]|nr:hypothetical protein [Anaerolineales bacterium]
MSLPFDLSQVDWAMLGAFLVVLVIGWTIMKGMLRLTMRAFALGCVGLLVLSAVLTGLALFATR